MNVIENEIYAAIEKELRAATERFGLHHSWHEKYAVTLEEVQECVDEAGRMRSFLESVFDQIKENKPDKAEQLIRFVEDHAIRCAIEAIQVAAMCKKEIEEQPQEARWIVSSDGYYPYCSNCGARPQKMTKYCAECGCKMMKEVNDGESS